MTQAIGVIMIFGLIVFSIWSIVRPTWAFALVNLMFPFKQVIQGYLPALVQYGPQLSAGIAAIAGMAVLYKSTKKNLTIVSFFNPVTWCTLALYAMMTFALLYTPARESAMNMYVNAISYIILFLFIYPFLLSSLEELRKGLFITVTIGCILTVFYLLNPSARWAGGRFVVDLGYTYGVGDFTSNPLALADTGGMMMVAAALMNFRDKGRLGIVFMVGGLILGLGMAIVSGSRGQIIFAVLIAVAMFPVARKIKDAKQFLIVAFGVLFIVAMIFVTFSLFLNAEAMRRWDVSLLKEGSADRQQRFLEAMGFLASNPKGWIIGNGTNSFAYFTGHVFDYPHNIIAELLLDYGIIGFSLAAVAGAYTYQYARRMIAAWTDDPIGRGTVAAWAGICLFSLLVAFKQGSVVGQPVPFYFWIVLAKIYFDEVRAANVRTAALEEQAWGSESYPAALEYGQNS